MTALATAALSQRLLDHLTVRREELRVLLQAAADARASEQQSDGVFDFKDYAARETRAAVDDAALSHAAAELAQVSAALRRLHEGGYGYCQDCGEAIEQGRLLALPATPYCTACQAIHERPGPARRA